MKSKFKLLLKISSRMSPKIRTLKKMKIVFNYQGFNSSLTILFIDLTKQELLMNLFFTHSLIVVSLSLCFKAVEMIRTLGKNLKQKMSLTDFL